jgi:hypothetical protein
VELIRKRGNIPVEDQLLQRGFYPAENYGERSNVKKLATLGAKLQDTQVKSVTNSERSDDTNDQCTGGSAADFDHVQRVCHIYG